MAAVAFCLLNPWLWKGQKALNLREEDWYLSPTQQSKTNQLRSNLTFPLESLISGFEYDGEFIDTGLVSFTYTNVPYESAEFQLDLFLE